MNDIPRADSIGRAKRMTERQEAVLGVMRTSPDEEWGPTEIDRALTGNHYGGQSNGISPILKGLAKKGLVVPISKSDKIPRNKWKLTEEGKKNERA